MIRFQHPVRAAFGIAVLAPVMLVGMALAGYATTTSPSADPTPSVSLSCEPGTAPGAPDEDGFTYCQRNAPLIETTEAPAAKPVTATPTYTG